MLNYYEETSNTPKQFIKVKLFTYCDDVKPPIITGQVVIGDFAIAVVDYDEYYREFVLDSIDRMVKIEFINYYYGIFWIRVRRKIYSIEYAD